MRLSMLVEDKRKSGAIRYKIFRQSPKNPENSLKAAALLYTTPPFKRSTTRGWRCPQGRSRARVTPGRPPPPSWTDNSGNLIDIGSFDKAMLPATRDHHCERPGVSGAALGNVKPVSRTPL